VDCEFSGLVGLFEYFDLDDEVAVEGGAIGEVRDNIGQGYANAEVEVEIHGPIGFCFGGADTRCSACSAVVAGADDTGAEYY
jgi:hypothetical protein